MDVSSSSLLSHLDDAPREVRNEEDGSEPRARAQGVDGQLAGAQRHVVQPVIEDGEEDGRAADGDERVVEALGEGWHGLCDSRCSVGLLTTHLPKNETDSTLKRRQTVFHTNVRHEGGRTCHRG